MSALTPEATLATTPAAEDASAIALHYAPGYKDEFRIRISAGGTHRITIERARAAQLIDGVLELATCRRAH